MGIRIDIRKQLGTFRLAAAFESSASRIGILGASGCGKSMTLKSIAGIEVPDAGEICIDGKIFFDSQKKINVKPQKRKIGYLFQNYALFPHMTVEENIAAGLSGTKEEKKRRIREMIRKFHLEGLEEHLPGQLSGGQQQRTALARIMAYEPDMILLDEPFSALDGFLKDRLQLELEEMLADYRGTVIMVSHSRDEVYRFCEELIIMEQGSVAVSGKTKELFENPRYKEAAKLTGCKNFVRLHRVDAHTAEVTDWGIRLRFEREIPERCTWLGYRAHDFVPVWGTPCENCLKVQVKNKAELPFELQYYVKPKKQPACGAEEAEERGECSGKERDSEELICWFIQREQRPVLEKKGFPDYLKIVEEKCMFLE